MEILNFFAPALDNNSHRDLNTLAAYLGLVTAELKTTLNNVVFHMRLTVRQA
ncbi:MAG: hypothetical protein IIC56_04740 [Proteobacteria bacterium]|nr:hypothetical protein [Pseudomonadota bacterium]